MTVIVTGASRGIGRAIAERLHSKGYEVLGISREGDNTDRSPKANFKIQKADVCNVEDLNLIYESIKNKKVSGLINAAGVFSSMPIENFKYEVYKKIIDVNLIGLINTCSIFIKLMDKNIHTPIINISSISAHVPNEATVYSASKAGVNGFTSSLAKELRFTKIRPNTICPGLIETDMTRITSLDKNRWNQIVSAQPMGVQLSLDNVADVVEIFFDEKTSCIGGQFIQIG